MKVSLNLAQQFSNVDLKSIPHEELLHRIGAQLGAIEDVEDWKPKFEGAVIVKVVECVKHENADKLSVCLVDDGGKNPNVQRGEDGLIQVVCGAPNVHAGMYAIWLAPGVTVPNSRSTDPFVLDARDIRGVISNGMMASASELGISEDHSGIVEVTSEDAGREPIPGEPLTNYFGLDDFVIDCENKMFTHRPDCFGVLGVARELAGISGLKFISPGWYLKPTSQEPANHNLKIKDLPINTRIQANTKVYRLVLAALDNVSIKPSPIWLQAALSRLGQRPINNVVDITNYIMQLTGQPLHAYDADKLQKIDDQVSIEARMSRKGDKLKLLNGKEIVFEDEADILITSNDLPVGLAGVMGGFDTEVDENTKRIVLECASFDMYSIRRTSMRYGLFTDAVTRFNKGQSALQNDAVLWYAVKMLQELGGGQLAGPTIGTTNFSFDNDEYGNLQKLEVSVDFVNVRLGSNLSSEEMRDLLQNVEFVVAVKENALVIAAPFWRTDIEIPEDIVEEIGRLHGYDKLPVKLPPRTAKPTAVNALVDFKQKLRYKLAKAGANEVLTYSFVHGDLIRKTGTDPDKTAFHLRNAISPDLQYYRTSLIPSLLNKIHPNIKAQAGDINNQFALFEIGKTHIKGREDEDKLPAELEHVALVLAADDKTAKAKQAGAAYYLAKKYVDLLTNSLAVYELINNFEYPMTSHFAQGRSAVIKLGEEPVGVVGEFSPKVRAALKLPEFSAGLELDIIKTKQHTESNKYNPLPEYPGTSADITLEISADKTFEDIATNIKSNLEILAQEHGYQLELQPGDIFVPESGNLKRFTFRLLMNHPFKTMRTEEASAVVDELARIAESIGARKV
jgi:phenylalanyl-tRNA synthetase beta chain